MLKENLKSVKTWGDGDNIPFDLFPLYTTKKFKKFKVHQNFL